MITGIEHGLVPDNEPLRSPARTSSGYLSLMGGILTGTLHASPDDTINLGTSNFYWRQVYTTLMTVDLIQAKGNDEVEFANDIKLGTNYLSMTEMATPTAVADSNIAKLYAFNNSGNTELRVQFQDGDVITIAAQT
jgi:hypothetical protein